MQMLKGAIMRNYKHVLLHSLLALSFAFIPAVALGAMPKGAENGEMYNGVKVQFYIATNDDDLREEKLEELRKKLLNP